MAQVYKDKSEDDENADKSENTEETLEDEVNENETENVEEKIEPGGVVNRRSLVSLCTSEQRQSFI